MKINKEESCLEESDDHDDERDDDEDECDNHNTENQTSLMGSGYFAKEFIVRKGMEE